MLLEIFNLRLKFQDQVGNAKECYQRLHIMLVEQINTRMTYVYFIHSSESQPSTGKCHV